MTVLWLNYFNQFSKRIFKSLKKVAACQGGMYYQYFVSSSIFSSFPKCHQVPDPVSVAGQQAKYNIKMGAWLQNCHKGGFRIAFQKWTHSINIFDESLNIFILFQPSNTDSHFKRLHLKPGLTDNADIYFCL